MKQHSIYKHMTVAVVVMASCFALSSVPVSAEKNVKGLELGLSSFNKYSDTFLYYIYVKPGEKAFAKFTVQHIRANAKEGHGGTFRLKGPDNKVISEEKANAVTHGLPGNTDGKPSEVLLESPVATEAGVYSVYIESTKGMGYTGATSNTDGPFYMDYIIGATKTDANDIVLGRVWADEYKIYVQKPENIVDLSLFYASEEGYLYKADYRGFMGGTSIFKTNKRGIVYKGSCVSAYQSYAYGKFDTDAKNTFTHDSTSCGGQYKVFFAKPDPSLPQSVKLPNGQTTWLNNEIKNTSIENMKFVSANDKNVPLKGEVTATIKNYTGNTTLLVDTNGNKKFNDPEDRKIIFNTEGEKAKYLFDGKDNQGNIIPKNIRVTFRIDADKKGEIHFVRSDIETSRKGISVQRLSGAPVRKNVLYWNDGKLPTEKCGNWQDTVKPLENSIGVDSTAGVHGWNADGCLNYAGAPSHGFTDPEYTMEQYAAASSWGDERHIDDWTYDEGSARSSVIFYGEATPDETPAPKAPNTGAAQLVANGTKALPWLLGAGAIAYYLRRRA